MGTAVEADEFGSRLIVELKDEAVKLTQTRKSAVYRDKTDGQIIGEIIHKRGLKKNKLPPTQPQYPELVQYACTDWDFIRTRAELNGLLVTVDDGEIDLARIDFKGRVKHHFEYGLSEIYNFEIEADGGQQTPDVQSIAWDIKNQKLTEAKNAKAFSLTQGNLEGSEIAEKIGIETETLIKPSAHVTKRASSLVRRNHGPHPDGDASGAGGCTRLW